MIAPLATLARNVLPLLIALLLLAGGAPAPVAAGNWRVAPIKIYFDVKTRSEVITVTNDGDGALVLDISAVEWSQDHNGQDVYHPATDLVFFPKQLVIEPKKERVIRAGIKVPAATREKTYRLFIREVPDSRQATANMVAIAIQFGIPVFVAPPKEEIRGEIAAVTMKDGQFSVTVDNQGNSHFRVSRVVLQAKVPDGETPAAVEVAGGYLLAGTRKTFKADIPGDLCRRAESLDILVDADRITLSGSTNVDKATCSAP